MPLPPLDNLVRIGQLKAEPPAQAEFDGLVRSGQVRLADAANAALSLESRFDLAYNAAHALSLAAMRCVGASARMLGFVFDPEAARIVEMRLPPEEKMARLHRLDGTCRWSLLPFCAVGTEAGLLLAVRSDYVKVGSITYPRILLALTPGAVSDGGGYQALWGGRKERRHGESAAAASAVAQRPAG